MPAREERQITGDLVFALKQNTQIYGHLLEQRFGLFERQKKNNNTKFVILTDTQSGRHQYNTRNPDES